MYRYPLGGLPIPQEGSNTKKTAQQQWHAKACACQLKLDVRKNCKLR